MKIFRSILAIALSCSAITTFATPISVIDQQNAESGTIFFRNFNTVNDGVTQGFMPTLSGVDAFELQMWTTGTSTDLQLDLFAGDGDGGALLGSSLVLTILNTTSAVTHFDFASTVALTPGTLYSLRLTHLGGAEANLDVTGNNYSGGMPRNPDGTPFPTYDLVFTEGLHRSAPVPAPATLALFALALAGLGRSRRKKA